MAEVTAVLQRTATSVLESAAAFHESVKCSPRSQWVSLALGIFILK